MSMLALLLISQGGDPVTADQAMTAHRRMTAASSSLCPEARGPEQVVICARNRDSQYRLLYPAERGPPDMRIPGEVRPIDMNAQAGSCGTVGIPHGCGGGLDILGIAAMVVLKTIDMIQGTDPPPVPPPPD